MKHKINNTSFFVGLFWVLFGFALLADNMGWIDFRIRDVLNLWPLLVIALGIKYLPVKEHFKSAGYLLMMLFFFLLLFTQKQWKSSGPWSKSFVINLGSDNYEEEDDAIDDEGEGKNEYYFVGETQQNIKEVEVEMALPVSEFDVEETTEKLYEFVAEDIPFELEQKFNVTGHKAHLKINPIDNRGDRKINSTSSMEMKLHPGIVWSFDISAGASDVEMDLRNFKVKKLKIDSGASQIDLTLGDRLSRQTVLINADASDIHVKVPEDAGVELKTRHVLGVNKISGLDKVRKGLYRSKNYDRSDRKIIIEITSAIGSFALERY